MGAGAWTVLAGPRQGMAGWDRLRRLDLPFLCSRGWRIRAGTHPADRSGGCRPPGSGAVDRVLPAARSGRDTRWNPGDAAAQRAQLGAHRRPAARPESTVRRGRIASLRLDRSAGTARLRRGVAGRSPQAFTGYATGSADAAVRRPMDRKSGV